MLIKLEPLLYSSDTLTATRDRTLPDAFTDALAPSHSSAPLRPPPKWKVAALTCIALWLVIYVFGRHAEAEMVLLGVTDVHVRTALTSLVNVAFNVYVGVPLVMTVVGHWLERPRAPTMDTQPWKAFDQGLRSQWSRLLVTLAFFVPTITLWVIHAHADAAAGGANATLVDSFDGEGR